MDFSLAAVQSRAAEWVAQIGFEHQQTKLPLSWPRPSNTAECPKLRFRSHYRYLGWEELREESQWEGLRLFTLLLSLVVLVLCEWSWPG